MSLIKQKQKRIIKYVERFFNNLKGEPYVWIPIMTKKSVLCVQIETEFKNKICSYYVHVHGIDAERPYLVCGNCYLYNKMIMVKNYKRLGKERRENVEYYYNNIWLSLPLLPELKRNIMEYL